MQIRSFVSYSNGNSSSPPNRRRASRSIAIKNNYCTGGTSSAIRQLDLLAAEEDSVSNERMYDCATWRMYNRIVDHRRNQHHALSSSSTRRGFLPASCTSATTTATTTCNVGSYSSSPPHYYSLGGDDSLDPTRQGCYNNSNNNNNRGALDFLYDGEVFELDI